MPFISDAQGDGPPEGSSTVTASGIGHSASGGVFDYGAHEEDGPVTREILSVPL
jgi:hypothetical protein